jgi:hypothetical protein
MEFPVATLRAKLNPMTTAVTIAARPTAEVTITGTSRAMIAMTRR